VRCPTARAVARKRKEMVGGGEVEGEVRRAVRATGKPRKQYKKQSKTAKHTHARAQPITKKKK